MANTRMIVLGFLIVATVLETTGDAVIRLGLDHKAAAIKAACFLAGAALLFGYGFALNSAPIPFEKVVGIYIATLFVVWQITSFAFFRHTPTLPIVAGGTLIVAGGLIVAFWQPAAAAQ